MIYTEVKIAWKNGDFLREHAVKIISERKKKKLLANEQQK